MSAMPASKQFLPPSNVQSTMTSERLGPPHAATAAAVSVRNDHPAHATLRTLGRATTAGIQTFRVRPGHTADLSRSSRLTVQALRGRNAPAMNAASTTST